MNTLNLLVQRDPQVSFEDLTPRGQKAVESFRAYLKNPEGFGVVKERWKPDGWSFVTLDDADEYGGRVFIAFPEFLRGFMAAAGCGKDDMNRAHVLGRLKSFWVPQLYVETETPKGWEDNPYTWYKLRG